MEKTTHLSNTDGEMLLRIAKSFVGPLIPKGVIPKHEADDLEQKIILDVVSHYHLFDPAVSSLSTFAHMRMESALKKVLRDLGKKGDFLRNAVSLNEMVESDDDDETERIELLVSPHEYFSEDAMHCHMRTKMLVQDMRNFIAMLDTKDKAICLSLMERGQRTTAKNFNMSHKQIRYAIQRIRAKMQTYGLDSYIEKK